MVTLGRFELPTSGLGNRCSIQLSYRATLILVRLRVPGQISNSLPSNRRSSRAKSRRKSEKEARTRRPRYQQGNIRKVPKANGIGLESGFSEIIGRA